MNRLKRYLTYTAVKGRKGTIILTAVFLCMGIQHNGMEARADTAADSVMDSRAPESGESNAAHVEEKDAMCLTRKLGESYPADLKEPDTSYWDKAGKEYELASWSVEMIPEHEVTERLEKQIVYAGVEGAEALPESITVEEEMSGRPAMGRLFMRGRRIVKEEWQDGFAAPVTFHSYGADEYQVGSLVIRSEDMLASMVQAGGELLGLMGLSSEEYRILGLEWDGEPYMDEDGQVCRRAVASGQKLTRDYEITYEGEVTWKEPESYELKMFYRPVIQLPVPAQASVPVEAGAQESVTQEVGGALWYWVRSGFVITVGAGLIGILLGALILLISWLRENRRERLGRYLSLGIPIKESFSWNSWLRRKLPSEE